MNLTLKFKPASNIAGFFVLKSSANAELYSLRSSSNGADNSE